MRLLTGRKRLLVSFADALGAAVFAFFRLIPRRKSTAPVRSVLVLEFWGIGDTVLATPALERLRRAYPGAAISVLVRPHGAEILKK